MQWCKNWVGEKKMEAEDYRILQLGLITLYYKYYLEKQIAFGASNTCCNALKNPPLIPKTLFIIAIIHFIVNQIRAPKLSKSSTHICTNEQPLSSCRTRWSRNAVLRTILWILLSVKCFVVTCHFHEISVTISNWPPKIVAMPPLDPFIEPWSQEDWVIPLQSPPQFFEPWVSPPA